MINTDTEEDPAQALMVLPTVQRRYEIFGQLRCCSASAAGTARQAPNLTTVQQFARNDLASIVLPMPSSAIRGVQIQFERHHQRHKLVRRWPAAIRPKLRKGPRQHVDSLAASAGASRRSHRGRLGGHRNVADSTIRPRARCHDFLSRRPRDEPSGGHRWIRVTPLAPARMN